MPEAFVSVRPRVKVKGQPRDDLGEALRAFSLSLPQHGVAHGELHAVHWGVAPDGGGEADYRLMDIELGDEVEVLMDHEDQELSLFKGEITALEERYGDGAPHLAILVQDRLHRLARMRSSRTFEDQSPDDLVSRIASDGGLSPDANVSTVTATWHQVNESHLAFLLRVLAPFGVPLRLRGGDLRARPEEPDREPVALSVSDNALSVRLIADLNHQPTETAVLGFDPGADSDLSAGANSTSDPADGTTAKDRLSNLGWPGAETVPRPFPWKQGLADAYAQAHLDRRARAFVSGEIRCIGDPRLAGGREIELSGTSPRLTGRYRVVQCVHRFDSADGFRTQLRVARADWGA